jgi:hypothetical protein
MSLAQRRSPWIRWAVTHTQRSRRTCLADKHRMRYVSFPTGLTRADRCTITSITAILNMIMQLLAIH